MPNSTTPVAGGVRPRTPAQMASYWAEKAKNIPTQEEIIRSDQVISYKFIDHDDRSSDRVSNAKEAHSKAFNQNRYPSGTQEVPKVRSPLKPSSDNTSTKKSPLFDHTLSNDPDGLNDKIRGKYASVLKDDESMLLARSWGVHPADLTKAFNRMGVDWVRKEIGFVAANDKVSRKGAYLAKLLAKNPY